MFTRRVERLCRIAQRVAAAEAGAEVGAEPGGAVGAERELEALLGEVGDDPDPRTVLLYVFGAALARRLSGASARRANLYLEQFEVPQIHLFGLLVSSLPLVGLATTLSNTLLERACRGQTRATVVDVGIGSGRQMVELIGALATARRDAPMSPTSLTIIGIEPAASALADAERSVRVAAERAGLEVTFHGFAGPAEALTEAEWRRLGSLCASPPIINASFALHHVSDLDGDDVRDDVLRRLRWLAPALLVLSEPNLHSHEKDFLTRFHLCFAHFSAVFGAIDRLPIELRDRNALKVCFFGREIVDMLGSQEELRTERHERTSSWLGRLAASGWRISPAHLEGALPASSQPGIEVLRRGDHASVEVEAEPLVSVLCAVPCEAEAGSAEAAIRRAPQRNASASAPVAEPFDAESYLTALRAVAMADQVLHERERAFIMEQAHALGVPLDLGASVGADERDLQAALARAAELSHRTRVAIVRDLVYLARVDGDYSADERALIASIAERLGLREDLAQIEARADLPSETRGMPSWFRECWFVGTK